MYKFNKNQWRFMLACALLSNPGGCTLTPPAEFQAYEGKRVAQADHATFLNNGGAFVVRVDDKRTGSIAQGGYADTVFVLPGKRRIHLNSKGFGASAETVYVCVDAKAGGVYSAMRTLLPGDPLNYAQLWIRDNHSDVKVGTAVGMTEDCP